MMQLDVEQSGAMEAVFDAIRERWGRLDFILHSIACAAARVAVAASPTRLVRVVLRRWYISCHSFVRMHASPSR